MSIVYRYINKETKQIEYIGIVYSDKKILLDRMVEHSKEEKFQDKEWKIQYFECENRSVAEAWESHLIEKYETYKYLNVCKKGWGLNPYIPNDEDLWQDFTEEAERRINKAKNIAFREEYGINIKDIFEFTNGRFLRIFKNKDFDTTNKVSIYMDGLTQDLFENKTIQFFRAINDGVWFLAKVKGYGEYIFHKIIIEEYSEDIINEVKRIM